LSRDGDFARSIEDLKRMKAFDVVVAKDATQALAVLAEHGARASCWLGTDLLVDLKSAAHVPEVVVDISAQRAWTGSN
jgi:hypothetical protein